MANNFIVGKTYTTRSICAHNCIYKAVVLKKTEKTVTIETRMEGPKTKKVMTDNEGKQYFTRLVDIRCYVKFGRVK